MITPAYYPHFRCAASACRDTCCKDWIIDIDSDALQQYRAHTGCLSATFHDAIEGDPPHFHLTAEGRCPLLTDDGLCAVQRDMGEGALCAVCAAFPRFFETVEGFTFGGVGLGCEAAAALILDPAVDDTVDLQSVRMTDETDGVLLDRFARLMTDAARWADVWLSDDRLFTSAVFDDVVALFAGLKPLTGAWSRRLSHLDEARDQVLAARREFAARFPETKAQYARLTRYFFFRHFWRARTFEDIDTGILSEIQLAMLSVIMIHLLDVLAYLDTGGFDLAEQTRIVTRYSREIEYDDDNRVAVEDFLLAL